MVNPRLLAQATCKSYFTCNKLYARLDCQVYCTLLINTKSMRRGWTHNTLLIKTSDNNMHMHCIPIVWLSLGPAVHSSITVTLAHACLGLVISLESANCCMNSVCASLDLSQHALSVYMLHPCCGYFLLDMVCINTIIQ